MKLKLAFAGFRHGHILSLYQRAQQGEDIEIVAACEEDEETRGELERGTQVEISHTCAGAMLDEVECDAVAVGDYYARRGSLIVEALSRGRHAIADKPLCTRLDELERIEILARSKNLKVGCMLTLRDSAPMRGLRQVVQAGLLGEIHAISFGGQHPLLAGSRPAWYFEPGKHGGTINDIGVHAIDAIPWITGLEFATVNAARCWNAFAPEHPHFEDGAQMMLSMENGCGVLGDVSYFAPDAGGYSMPFYWRMSLWGRRGVAETASAAKEIFLLLAGHKALQTRALPAAEPGGYLRSFLRDIAGRTRAGELDTAAVLGAARTVLKIQRAADENEREISLNQGRAPLAR